MSDEQKKSLSFVQQSRQFMTVTQGQQHQLLLSVLLLLPLTIVTDTG